MGVRSAGQGCSAEGLCAPWGDIFDMEISSSGREGVATDSFRRKMNARPGLGGATSPPLPASRISKTIASVLVRAEVQKCIVVTGRQRSPDFCKNRRPHGRALE